MTVRVAPPKMVVEEKKTGDSPGPANYPKKLPKPSDKKPAKPLDSPKKLPKSNDKKPAKALDSPKKSNDKKPAKSLKPPRPKNRKKAKIGRLPAPDTATSPNNLKNDDGSADREPGIIEGGMVEIAVPEGSHPGQSVTAMLDGGHIVHAKVPRGLKPGMTFLVPVSSQENHAEL